MTSPESKLKEIGLVLPPVPPPLAAYVATVRTGNLVYVAGQVPLVDGKPVMTGRLGKLTIEEGQKMARLCAAKVLAAVRAEVGSLDRVKRVVRVGVFVASEDGFFDQPKVANGASELFQEVFGDAGKHARAAVGVNALPMGVPVEVEALFEVQ